VWLDLGVRTVPGRFESIKEVTLIPVLEHRGVIIVWDVVEGRERGDLSKGDVVMGAC
jgi:hypothetical protein